MRTFRATLVALLLLPLVAVHARAQFLYVTNNNAITITAYIGSATEVTIPAGINGLPVTCIQSNALANHFIGNTLDSIVLPGTITNIGDNAFQYEIITNFTIPDSVTSLGAGAFNGCGQLTTLAIGSGLTNIGTGAIATCLQLSTITVDPANPAFTCTNGALFNKDQTTLVKYLNPTVYSPAYTVPASVTNIGEEAFRDTSLDAITLPSGLLAIGDFAFYLNNNLNSITIPGTVTTIGDFAFADCDQVSFEIPASVTKLGSAPFIGGSVTAINVDPANPAYSSTNGVLFNKDQTVLEEYPNGLGAATYSVPGTVTNIADLSFAYTYPSPLSDVEIPASVTGIGSQTFLFTMLREISVDPANPVFSSVNGVLFNKDQTTLLTCPLFLPQTSYTIPDTVTNVGDLAFEYSLFSSVTVPDSVISLGYGAFAGSDITSITLGTNLQTIGTEAFNFCGSLASITLPASVTSIGYSAFGDCIGLQSITVGNGITSIGGYAFNNCYFTSFAIPDSVTSLGANAFNSCPYLTNLTIGAGLSCIPARAFSECPRLTHVVVPRNISRLGEAAFGDCVSLAGVSLANGLLVIGDGAFCNCPSLTDVTMPSSVAALGDNAFAGCSNLASAHFYGNAPAADLSVFTGDSATAYYLPGTAGWGLTFAGIPTAPWILPEPVILTGMPGFGLQSNQFGFTVSWETNASVVVEAATDLSGSPWVPLQTNSLTNGSFNFSDAQWTNFPSRYYRVQAQ